MIKAYLFVNAVLISINSWGQGRAEKYSEFFYTGVPSPELVSKVAMAGAKAACTAGACLGRNTVAEVQALALMTSLAAIEGAKQQFELSGIKKENVRAEEVVKAARDSAEHLLQSSDTAGGLAAMFVTNKSMQVPIETWNTVVANTSMRPLLKEFIAHSSGTLVGFVGFEAGAELIHRAVEMIPDLAEREKARKLIPTLWRSLIAKDQYQTTADRLIAKKVWTNATEILVNNQELREKWWSFVTRNRIQTGGFAVGIAMMSAGTTAGSRLGACIPNPAAKVASPALGFLLGVGAGVGASFVSKDVKADITEAFQSGRILQAKSKMETSQSALLRIVGKMKAEQTRLFEMGLTDRANQWRLRNLEQQMNDELSNLNLSRQDMVTSYYDRFHLLNSRLYELDNKIQLAREHQNTDTERQLSQVRSEYLGAFDQSKSELLKQLEQESDFFSLSSKFPKDSPMKRIFEENQKQSESLRRWTDAFLTQTVQAAPWGRKTEKAQQPTSMMSEQETQRLLEKIYFWGFSEKPFVETMEYNN